MDHTISVINQYWLKLTDQPLLDLPHRIYHIARNPSIMPPPGSTTSDLPLSDLPHRIYHIARNPSIMPHVQLKVTSREELWSSNSPGPKWRVRRHGPS